MTDADCDMGQIACVNEKCSCPDEMLAWDESKRKCLGIPGSRCRFIQVLYATGDVNKFIYFIHRSKVQSMILTLKQLERILALRMDIPTECIENSVCVEHVTGLDGRCECMKGFHFSKFDMKCISHK